MRLDVKNQFSDEQDIFTAASNDSTEKIDLKAPRNIGVGGLLHVFVVVDDALVGAGTVTVSLKTADNKALTTNAVEKVILTIPATAKKGTNLIHTISPGEVDKRWLGLEYNKVGAVTAGKVSAWVVDNLDNWKAYPDNVVIKP